MFWLCVCAAKPHALFCVYFLNTVPGCIMACAKACLLEMAKWCVWDYFPFFAWHFPVKKDKQKRTKNHLFLQRNKRSPEKEGVGQSVPKCLQSLIHVYCALQLWATIVGGELGTLHANDDPLVVFYGTSSEDYCLVHHLTSGFSFWTKIVHAFVF